MTSVSVLEKPQTAFELAPQATLRSSSFPLRPPLRRLHAQQFGGVEQVLWSPRTQFQQKQVGSLGDAYRQTLNFHGRSVADDLRFPCARRKEEITPDRSGRRWHVKTNQAANRVVESPLFESSRQPIALEGQREGAPIPNAPIDQEVYILCRAEHAPRNHRETTN